VADSIEDDDSGLAIEARGPVQMVAKAAGLASARGGVPGLVYWIAWPSKSFDARRIRPGPAGAAVSGAGFGVSRGSISEDGAGAAGGGRGTFQGRIRRSWDRCQPIKCGNKSGFPLIETQKVLGCPSTRGGGQCISKVRGPRKRKGVDGPQFAG